MPLTNGIAAAFDYEGPPATLVKRLKYGGQIHLAKGAAAYLAAQFLQMNWPFPDYIVPMPMPLLRRFERGYNQSYLLAQALGNILGRPVCNAVKRSSGEYSQAGLNHQQRLQLSADGFRAVKKIKMYDKRILIVDDVMTTGSSFRCCAEALQELCPESIYALSFCRAL